MPFERILYPTIRIDFSVFNPLNQSITNRKLHQASGVFGVGFFDHFLSMRIYGVEADEKFVGDVFAAVAFGYEFQNLDFTFT